MFEYSRNGDCGLGTGDWGKRKEDHSPVPAAQITEEDLTQRRKGAKNAKEEGRKGGRERVLLARFLLNR
jgi:hypothetical protein